MVKLIENIKPSDINTKSWFMGTSWNKSECETIARNIVIISKSHNDDWEPFTWQDYKDRVSHDAKYGEEVYLDRFASCGDLEKEGDSYTVTNQFIGRLAEYIKD